MDLVFALLRPLALMTGALVCWAKGKKVGAALGALGLVVLIVTEVIVARHPVVPSVDDPFAALLWVGAGGVWGVIGRSISVILGTAAGVAAVRLARPDSMWARRYYAPDKMALARARAEEGSPVVRRCPVHGSALTEGEQECWVCRSQEVRTGEIGEPSEGVWEAKVDCTLYEEPKGKPSGRLLKGERVRFDASWRNWDRIGFDGPGAGMWIARFQLRRIDQPLGGEG